MKRHREIEDDVWGEAEDEPPDHVIERFIARHEHDLPLGSHKPRAGRPKRKATGTPEDNDANRRG